MGKATSGGGNFVVGRQLKLRVTMKGNVAPRRVRNKASPKVVLGEFCVGVHGGLGGEDGSQLREDSPSVFGVPVNRVTGVLGAQQAFGRERFWWWRQGWDSEWIEELSEESGVNKVVFESQEIIRIPRGGNLRSHGRQ